VSFSHRRNNRVTFRNTERGISHEKSNKAGISMVLSLAITPAQASGPYLPDATATPGALNPAVTQENIASTICTLGYTAKIRPPVSYTTRLKIKQLSSAPYSKYGSTVTSQFEEDHLISLELGGSPTNPKNLWPEPWAGIYGARAKDKLENKLHALVCANQLSLADAQRLISTNWFAAYKSYVEAGTVGLNLVTKPGPINDHSSIPAGATGKCRDRSFSFALHHSGMCRHHGGVAEFL